MSQFSLRKASDIFEGPDIDFAPHVIYVFSRYTSFSVLLKKHRAAWKSPGEEGRVGRHIFIILSTHFQDTFNTLSTHFLHTYVFFNEILFTGTLFFVQKRPFEDGFIFFCVDCLLQRFFLST